MQQSRSPRLVFVRIFGQFIGCFQSRYSLFFHRWGTEKGHRVVVTRYNGDGFCPMGWIGHRMIERGRSSV